MQQTVIRHPFRLRLAISAGLAAGLVASAGFGARPAWAAKAAASVAPIGVTVATVPVPGSATAVAPQVVVLPEAPRVVVLPEASQGVASQGVASQGVNITVGATTPGAPVPPPTLGDSTSGAWGAAQTIDWPAGTTVNDVLTSFGFPGAVPAGSGPNVSTALPVDGVVRVTALASTVDPLAVTAREALDALLARHDGGAPPVLVSTDAIESAFKAQLPNALAETNPEVRYARARANLAVMISGRTKVSAADLDQTWARTDERRMVAVFAALAQVGTLYQWSGAKPGGFDCSGLTSYAFSVAGVKVPRTSTQQSEAMALKDVSQLQPGDLLWRPGHIGLYLGAGDAMVHSPQTGKPVQVRSYGKISRFGSFF